MARINVTVPDEMKDWLDEQPHLKASGLLQKAVQKQMSTESTSDHNEKKIEYQSKEFGDHIGIACPECGDEMKPRETNNLLYCPRCGHEPPIYVD